MVAVILSDSSSVVLCDGPERNPSPMVAVQYASCGIEVVDGETLRRLFEGLVTFLPYSQYPRDRTDGGKYYQGAEQAV
jgi:hypothetical protein